MKFYLIFFLPLFATGYAQEKKKALGHTRTKEVELIDTKTFLLSEASTDKTYGFDKANPIDVGGVTDDGILNERRFLNALLTIDGKPLKYHRVGSCCPFETPNGFIGDSGMLDHYRVYEEGKTDTLSIYINLYDKGDLKIPVGLTAKK